MEISQLLVPVICLLSLGVPLVVVFIVVFFWLPKREGDTARKDFTKYAKALLERGVTSPADVLSVTDTAHRRKLGGGVEERRLEYDIEVHPEDGRPSFRAKFESWLPTWRHQTDQWIMLQKRDEEVKKIWVTYDPNDPIQMIVHHFDYEHEKILAKNAWVQRRNAFIDFENESVSMRESGEEALATILEAEDVNVATEEEKKAARSMRLKFNVTPIIGSPFESETYGMIANESIEKLSLGKKVYVKFHKNDPGKTVLMRSAE